MEQIKEIYTDQIDDPAVAMRGELDREKLFDLADNIKQNGLINPITVRPKNSRFEVVAGHRRLSACKIAGLIKITCVVRELDDEKTFEVMAAENLERADVDLLEEAIFLKNYIERTGKTIPETAKSIKRSIAYVESRLTIGMMPDYMQEFLKLGKLKLGAALALFEISDPNILRTYVEMAVRDGISVAQADYWVHGWRISKLPGGSLAEIPAGDFVAGEPQAVLFECALDGKKYDARLMKSMFVYEGNMEFFSIVSSEFRKSPPSSDL